jgi:endo-1,4-beta-xylanase
LYINDYNIESMNNKSMVHAELAKSMLAAGVPIDGVGFQCHFIGGTVPEDLAETMAMFTDMGLEVALTELDVRVPVNNRGVTNSTWLDIQYVFPNLNRDGAHYPEPRTTRTSFRSALTTTFAQV